MPSPLTPTLLQLSHERRPSEKKGEEEESQNAIFSAHKYLMEDSSQKDTQRITKSISRKVSRFSTTTTTEKEKDANIEIGNRQESRDLVIQQTKGLPSSPRPPSAQSSSPRDCCCCSNSLKANKVAARGKGKWGRQKRERGFSPGTSCVGNDALSLELNDVMSSQLDFAAR